MSEFVTPGHYTSDGSTRGFGPKITAIVDRLNASGAPPDLRLTELETRVGILAKELGYKDDEIPSRWTIKRRIVPV
jgi:hypothetical protein